MTPINNSDTAWLIVADYNQENSIGYPEALREDVLEVIKDNVWCWENGVEGTGFGFDVGSVGSGAGGYQVGSSVGNGIVGCGYFSRIRRNDLDHGILVGGHENDE